MIDNASLDHLRAMASAMSSATPMSADMLAGLIDDIERDGPVARLINDHPAAGSPLFCIRVLAGVRWLVLRGDAPELAAHLRTLSNDQGRPEYDLRTWELFRATVLSNPERIRQALDRPVQQHQPGRAAWLLEGLTMVAPEGGRIQLLELGACAGLNLLFDRYRWFGQDWQWGDRNSPVRLTSKGRRPGDLEVITRAGCDLSPRDAGDPDDAMILRSFIPSERETDQWDLDDALALAARHAIRVDEADAVEWLTYELDLLPSDGSAYTVVWHSLFWWYLAPEDHRAIERILAAAARRMPLARVSFEPPSLTGMPRLDISVYS